MTKDEMNVDDLNFQEALYSIIPLLADYLSGEVAKGVDMLPPEKVYQKARSLMKSEVRGEVSGKSRLENIVRLYLETGLYVHSTSSLGRQYTGNIPLAAVMDLVNSVVNQPASFYEASQLPCVAERIMGEELNRFVGMNPDTFTMLQTSGGSLANVTALLAARNNRYPECSRKGMASLTETGKPAVALGTDAHYSLIRAVNMLGIGREGIVWLPLDNRRRIDADKVPAVLEDAKRKGLDVFCLVASAGSTSVGAVDPLDKLADIARERGLWMHVDGCHGASLLLSDKLRHKLKGVERADSLSWDAHKMLFVPSPCSMLFYQDRQKAGRTFQESASYVKSSSGEEYGNGELNFECTKRPTMMNLWTIWALYGRELFASRVERLCALCTEAWETLCEQPDFETLHKPEMNIMCFRYNPGKLPEGMSMNDFQLAVRERVCRRGNFFISKTVLDGKAVLRVVIMNYRHTAETFTELLQEIRTVGKELMSNY